MVSIFGYQEPQTTYCQKTLVKLNTFSQEYDPLTGVPGHSECIDGIGTNHES